MILGMSFSTFTVVHVLLSLVGIGAGLLVVYGLLLGKRFDGATAIFLVTTVLTSLTGFLFPFERVLPSHILGVISLAALVLAMMARYARYLAGAWRPTYVVCAVLALYFNVFVLVVQIFEKVPAAHALAPTQKEAPFAVVQLLVLTIFVVLGVLAVKKCRAPQAATAPSWTRTKAS
jgi:hypothetical protein